MPALLQLMEYFDRKEAEQVRLETQRRAENRIAEQEGKRRAMEKEYISTFKEIQEAQNTERSLTGMYDRALAEKTLTPEYTKMIEDARFNNRVKLQSASDKMGALQLERDLMLGKVDKKTANAYTSIFDNLYEKDKDPYDQIKEERSNKGGEEVVTQTGPASAFQALDQSRLNQVSQASGTMFGGAYADPVTPEYSMSSSYVPVRNQGGVTKEEDVSGATEVDPMATLPNPNPVASQMTNPAAPAPKIGDFVRVKNKATGETGTLPSANARAAIASGKFEQVP